MQALVSFLKSGKKAALIHGPVGCGKTSAVYALASELGYELLELNAGDFRDKEKIKGIVGRAISQRSLFFKRKMILIDEIDNLSSKDRGGINEILSVIYSTSSPVIMCANKPFEKRLNPLRKAAAMVEFKKVSRNDTISILQRICENENISASENALKQLALLSDGDIRAAINDLHASGNDIGQVAVSKRDQEVAIFDALRSIFRSSTMSVLHAIDNVDMDFEEVILWIDENITLEYNNRELYGAYLAISKADIFKRRIMRQNYWRLLVYATAMLTAGVAMSKQSGNLAPIQYRRASRMLKIWMANNSQKKSLAKKFAAEMHCSAKKVFREMPYLKIIMKDQSVKQALSEKLGLNNEDMEFLSGAQGKKYRR
jgi:replication factor C large subunit